MSTKLVSIIIPTYNRAHLIGETLDSLIAQTYKNWECIVVDDGSSDDTDLLLQNYSQQDCRFLYVKRKSLPKGASKCRNIGLKRAKGDYCIFLDSDDLLLDFCLETRLDQADKFPDNLFWVFPMYMKNINCEPKVLNIPERISYLKEFLSYKIHWGIMSTLWQINFLKSLNGFNENYPRLNDPEIHIRAIINARNSYKIFSNNDPDSIYNLNAEFKNMETFALKYYNSLMLFIPDIKRELGNSNNNKLIPLLKSYLKDYHSIGCYYVHRNENFKLFKLFYDNEILSYFQYKKIKALYLLVLMFEKFKRNIKKNVEKTLVLNGSN